MLGFMNDRNSNSRIENRVSDQVYATVHNAAVTCSLDCKDYWIGAVKIGRKILEVGPPDATTEFFTREAAEEWCRAGARRRGFGNITVRDITKKGSKRLQERGVR